jgi:hypothetical protein
MLPEEGFHRRGDPAIAGGAGLGRVKRYFLGLHTR